MRVNGEDAGHSADSRWWNDIKGGLEVFKLVLAANTDPLLDHCGLCTAASEELTSPLTYSLPVCVWINMCVPTVEGVTMATNFFGLESREMSERLQKKPYHQRCEFPDLIFQSGNKARFNMTLLCLKVEDVQQLQFISAVLIWPTFCVWHCYIWE